MSKEENLKILQLLQEGKITADEASQLLAAMEKPTEAPTPPPAPEPEKAPPPVGAGGADDFESETLNRARAKIAAAREKVAGMDQQLAAAEEQIEEAKKSPDPIGALNQALKGLPGAKSIAGSFRDFDAGRFASNAAKQARKLGKQVTDSIGNIDINLNLNDITQSFQGEPTLEQAYEVTLAVPSGQTLRVKNPFGDITVQGGDFPEVRAAGTLRVWAATPEEAQAVAEAIQVTTESNETGGAIIASGAVKAKRVQLNLKVFVPAEGVKVSLLSPSGDLSVRGVKAAVVAASQSGDIQLSEIMGDVAAETTAGDIALEGILGAASARTTSGSVQALRLDGASFKAESQSGDISLSDAIIPTVSLSAVSGDSTVRSVTSQTLSIRAVSGDVSVEEHDGAEETLLDSVSGDLSFSPKGSFVKGKLVVSTISGDTNLSFPYKTNAVLEARSKSGELRGKVRDSEGNFRKIKGAGMAIVSESIGEGTGAMVVLSSISGDINVEQAEG
ncbi:DUF4097 family beta strand repeat-containing protein [Armatimonas sp.]|uniref:DUF4097 family beta strand repeat-containing protein n=1 Tax=Armatimonas sp. TaxID=1872638 RepID=UPI00286C973A|nr:DUF4097 family beta strand repeat-containing protein [Armatimonas sp.]